MDSFEFNKIAGGALSALLFIFGAGELSAMLGGGHGGSHGPSKGYTLPAPKDDGKGGSAPAAAAFSWPAVAALLEKANPDSGKDVFKACTQCHTVEKGGAAKLGPNLHGVIGRDVGKHGGFAYSPAMAEKGGKWTWDALATYLNDPKGAIPGNKMAYAGVKDPSELADLLVYMRSLSDAPAPLPAAPK